MYNNQNTPMYSAQPVVHYQSQPTIHYRASQHTCGGATLCREYRPLASPSSQYKQATYHYETPTQQNYHAITPFLPTYRPQTQFVDNAEQIESLVRETFEKTTGRELPNNIVFHVLDKDDMKRIHEQHGQWTDTIQGFSINSKYKQVVVKKGDLDKVMLVMGHEIGHVLSQSLPTLTYTVIVAQKNTFVNLTNIL